MVKKSVVERECKTVAVVWEKNFLCNIVLTFAKDDAIRIFNNRIRIH